jgi:hypothetical protein
MFFSHILCSSSLLTGSCQAKSVLILTPLITIEEIFVQSGRSFQSVKTVCRFYQIGKQGKDIKRVLYDP